MLYTPKEKKKKQEKFKSQNIFLENLQEENNIWT